MALRFGNAKPIFLKSQVSFKNANVCVLACRCSFVTLCET